MIDIVKSKFINFWNGFGNKLDCKARWDKILNKCIVVWVLITATLIVKSNLGNCWMINAGLPDRAEFCFLAEFWEKFWLKAEFENWAESADLAEFHNVGRI